MWMVMVVMRAVLVVVRAVVVLLLLLDFVVVGFCDCRVGVVLIVAGAAASGTGVSRFQSFSMSQFFGAVKPSRPSE
jgi:hypothetical protein